MRPWSLISVLAVAAACNVRVPRGIGLPVAATATIRADVHVQAPAPVVAMQGATVPEFFGIPLDDAHDIVFVLDVSGSMSERAEGRAAQIAVANQPTPAPGSPPPPAPDTPGPPPGAQAPAPTVPTKIEVAKTELVEAVQRLPAGTRVDVVFFNHDLDAYAPDLVALDDASRSNITSFVEATTAMGSTALAPALRAAFVMNPRRVVLLSDGLGNVGGGPDAVLRDAREAIRGGVRIDTVGLGAGQDAQLMSALANESGGLYQAL